MLKHFMVLLLIVMVSAGGFATTAAQDDDLTTVRVGTVPVMVFAPVFIADAQGYFAEAGIEVEIQNNPGGAEPLAPLARDELDVVIGGIGAGQFNYAARNIDINDDPNFRIVASAHLEAPPVASPLVVSTERFESGEITSVEDLAGGRVAINAQGAATEYWLAQALAQGGLTFDDVEVVAVAFQNVAAALNSPSADRIDAAILGEPIAAAAEEQGLVTRLTDDFIDGVQVTFVYMANEFLENDRETAIAFTSALVRAYRDLQSPEGWNDPDVVDYLSEATLGFSANLLDFYAFPLFEPNGAIAIEDIELLQNYFIERDALTYDEPLDIEALIDASILEAAIEEIGEYDE